MNEFGWRRGVAVAPGVCPLLALLLGGAVLDTLHNAQTRAQALRHLAAVRVAPDGDVRLRGHVRALRVRERDGRPAAGAPLELPADTLAAGESHIHRVRDATGEMRLALERRSRVARDIREVASMPATAFERGTTAFRWALVVALGSAALGVAVATASVAGGRARPAG